MRRLITGVRNGQSCVVEVIEFHPSGSEVLLQDFITFRLDPIPRRPKGKALLLDLDIAPGEVRWITTYRPPNTNYLTMHHTNTIDCHTVIEGKVDLILDDGIHTLTAGDCVIINGVDHAWGGHDTGSKSSLILIGIYPPEDEIEAR